MRHPCMSADCLMLYASEHMSEHGPGFLVGNLIVRLFYMSAVTEVFSRLSNLLQRSGMDSPSLKRSHEARNNWKNYCVMMSRLFSA